MRVRPLLSAVLSVLSAILATPRRKAHALVVTVAVATVAVVTPILLADGSAAAEGTTTQPGQQAVTVTLSAPSTLTRGAATSLLAKVTTVGATALPAGTVQFVSRAPGATDWQPLGSASTGADGTTTLPVPAVDAATEFGAYFTLADGTVNSQTASTVVHVIDIAATAPSAVVSNTRVQIGARLVQDAAQGLPGQRVQVRFRPRGAAGWSRARWVTTNAQGAAAVAVRFTRTFQVGLRFPGAADVAPSPFVVKTVHVRPRAATSRGGFRFPFLDPSMAASPGSWSLDQGVDMFAQGEACGAAAKLVAVGDGTVIQTGISGFGPTAPVIRMSDGPFAGRNVYYGHTGRIYVHVGQHVHAGDLVAQIGCGSVGYSSAPHLEIGVGEPGGPPCCPAFGATARLMYRQLVAALSAR